MVILCYYGNLEVANERTCRQSYGLGGVIVVYSIWELQIAYLLLRYCLKSILL